MNNLKTIGSVALGLAIFIGLTVGSVLLFIFGAYVALAIAPAIYWLTGLLFVINIIALVAAIIPSARKGAGVVLVVSSFVYGIAAWVYGLAVTLSLWGVFAVIVGILLGGVGVVPIGMLAAAWNGEWGMFWTLIVTVVFTYATRVVGALLTGDSAHNVRTHGQPHHHPAENKRVWKDLE